MNFVGLRRSKSKPPRKAAIYPRESEYAYALIRYCIRRKVRPRKAKGHMLPSRPSILLLLTTLLFAGIGTLLFSGIGVLLVLAGVGVLFSLKKKSNRA